MTRYSQSLKLQLGESRIRFQKCRQTVEERSHLLGGHPEVVGIDVDVDLAKLTQESRQTDFELRSLELDLRLLTFGFRKCANLSWELKRLQTPWFDDVGQNKIKPRRKEAEMGSLLRSVNKRKKSRRLGEVEMVRHEDYGELALDAKVEMIRSLVPLGLMHVHELLDDEVKALAGER